VKTYGIYIHASGVSWLVEVRVPHQFYASSFEQPVVFCKSTAKVDKLRWTSTVFNPSFFDFEPGLSSELTMGPLPNNLHIIYKEVLSHSIINIRGIGWFLDKKIRGTRAKSHRPN
jgi:hypothetical protein